jgi:hypothetical protein
MGDEANCAYNESQTLTLRGQLDVDALRAALQALVDRHEALRTTLSPDGTTLCTQVNQSLEVPLRDWSSLPPAERQTKVDHCLHTAVSTPFDLEHGPLFRVEILRLEPTLHQVDFDRPSHRLRWLVMGGDGAGTRADLQRTYPRARLPTCRNQSPLANTPYN